LLSIHKAWPENKSEAALKFFAGIIFFSFLSSFSFSQEQAALQYSSLISSDDLNSFLKVLASDSLEGRETGKAGQKKAAEFIASQFSKNGLNPISHGGWFQHHPISTIVNRGKNIEVNQQFFLFGKDYFFLPGTKDTLIIQDSIYFAGYGISGEAYNDYENINPAGKAILFFNGHPINKKNKIPEGLSDWNNKIKAAYSRKPSVVFVICDSIDHVIDSLNYNTEKRTNALTGPPIVFISNEMAMALLPENENDKLDKARSFINRKNKPKSFASSSSAFVHLVSNPFSLEGENVIGYLEGTDKKNETIVISAHYDHLGKKDSVIYHGADDDGSGTSAVIELSKVFSKAKAEGHGPRRSMLFITFSGEESGLHGSTYYVNHPLIPLKQTVADLNIDMIGRTDEKHDSLGIRDYVYIIGSDKLSTDLHKINEQENAANTKLQLDYRYNVPDDPNRFYFRSDHYNFAKHKIPIVFYFNGVHRDYHSPGDTIEKIDFNLLKERTRLVFFTAWELANREERIKVDVRDNMGKDEE
jgi:hypothetical protein